MSQKPMKKLNSENPAEISLWQAIRQKVINNPTLVLFGLLIAAFVAGWGVRQFFETYKLNKLRTYELNKTPRPLDQKTQEAQKAKAAINRINELESQREKERKALIPYMGYEQVRELISEDVLNEWPQSVHDLIIASASRQLVRSPGKVLLMTPEGDLINLTMSFEQQGDVSKIVSSMKRNKYEAIEKSLRDKAPEVKIEELRSFYTDLTVYGVATQDFPLGGNQLLKFTVIMDSEFGISMLSRVLQLAE